MNKKTRARSHSSSNPRAALIIDYWKPQTLIWDCVVINVINDEDANVPRINAIPIHIDTPNPTGNTNTPSNGWWLLYCCDLVSVWSTSAHDSFCVCLYYSYSTLQTNIMCVNNNKIWFVVPLSGAVARSSCYRKDTSSSCSSYGLWYLRVFMCVSMSSSCTNYYGYHSTEHTINFVEHPKWPGCRWWWWCRAEPSRAGIRTILMKHND